jgi:small neutral amino acid transporter SnatA (MarC family)
VWAGFFCILSILLFGVFKDTETQQPFQFGIAVVGVVGCIILFMLASAIVFYSQRRRKLRPVRRPKVIDSTPEVVPLAGVEPVAT